MRDPVPNGLRVVKVEFSVYGSAVRVLINGEPHSIAAALTIANLIRELGLNQRRIAVEVNREIIARAVDTANAISRAFEELIRTGKLTQEALFDNEYIVIEGSDPVRPHEQIRLAVDPTACHLFDQTGRAFSHMDRHPLAA